MATGGIIARKCFIGFAATSSGTAAEVGEARNFSLNPTLTLADATSFDSSGWSESLDGTRGFTLTFDTIYARTETEQVSLRQALINSSGVSKHFTIRPSTAVTTLWRGQGYVTGFDLRGENGQMVLHNFTITGTRKLTYTT